MTRAARLDYSGAWHHVVNRGAHRQPVFLLDGDRRTFLHLVGVVRAEYRLEAHAFCLMGNHFHLLVHSPDGNLSDAMQYLLAVYTRRFNHRHDLDGPLFRGRFTSKVIESDAYLLQASRYIHRNPLDGAGPQALGSHRWSSYGAYLGRRAAPRWLQRHVVLGLVGDDIDRYRGYVERPQPGDRVRAGPTELSSAITEVEQAVAAVTGVSVVQLRHPTSGARNVARQLTLVVASEWCRASTQDLARHFGFTNPASLKVTLSRARRRLATDRTAQALHAQIRQHLEPANRGVRGRG